MSSVDRRPKSDKNFDKNMLEKSKRTRYFNSIIMLTIGEVAQRVGVRSSTVRYYERRRIIPPAYRRQNGYRSYDDKSIKLLLFTMRARSLGITLKEIKSILDLIFTGQEP